MTQADTAIERLIRERLADAFPDHGLVGEEYGTEGGRRVGPLVHRPDRRHAQLHPRRAAVRDAARGRARRRAPGRRACPRRRSTSAGGRMARRRGLGAEPGRGARGASACRASTRARRRPGPLRLGPGHRGVGPARRASTACSRDVWRERGFGDFWGYALVAEGAAEAMVEVGLTPWDAAAPLVLVEEAGGRVTDFEGRRAIDSGTFLATNGHPARDHPRATRRRDEEDSACRNPCRSAPAEGRPLDQATAPSTGGEATARTRRSPGAPDPLDRALEPAGRPVARLQRGVQPGRHVPDVPVGHAHRHRVPHRQPRAVSTAIVPVAAILLLADLYIGAATVGRLVDANSEELHAVRGMNRIRHAYREMVPGLEPYFVTSSTTTPAGSWPPTARHAGSDGAPAERRPRPDHDDRDGRDHRGDALRGAGRAGGRRPGCRRGGRHARGGRRLHARRGAVRGRRHALGHERGIARRGPLPDAADRLEVDAQPRAGGRERLVEDGERHGPPRRPSSRAAG